MDGDSSTTDASQLGMSGEYMAGSHYVLQSQDDDGDESLHDHEEGNGSKENFREQDIYLPIANVARIMKNAVPQTGKAMKGEKGIGGVSVTEGLGEELTDDSFANQLPAGIITADGQQQNVMVYTTSYQQIPGVQQIQFS
ncbi:nuclear transcription factor Y subunit beta isoform 2-T3 [Salvelinus alpinus]|uniref:nuclear transcription factor Y subunit beta isoform X2 n=1 Tax=Oncorhynchus masou masou TaxID=90313 RepID=UPI00318432E1